MSVIIFSIFHTSTVRVDDVKQFSIFIAFAPGIHAPPTHQSSYPAILPARTTKKMRKNGKTWRKSERYYNNNAIARIYTRLHAQRLYFISCCMQQDSTTGGGAWWGGWWWADGASNRFMPQDSTPQCFFSKREWSYW